ncbi:ABC transporter substrate-binding protein [Natrialba sp. INN-245]|uniref:ABC transporter substrate-binding protein n=1 Tax=Natrialba sp. INN-245 TaxID=2690967 RepID=UPI0013134926|nr:ABC transporter substrate-binding protein [Natrialba sp. INN-245]MWV39987.1 extracellular solute-binding protein [Natrialba sp. INN-245]
MGWGDTDGSNASRRAVLRRVGMIGGTAVVLAGCTSDGNASDDGDANDPDDTSQLELIHWWTAGGEEDALEALLDGFLEEHEEGVIEENPAPGGAGSALNAAVQSRLIDEEPPSTFQIWPGEALRPFVDSNVLAALDDIWSDDMREAYIDSVRELSQRNGVYVAVPVNIHRLNNLFYNVDVVEDVGVDPRSVDDPETLLEVFEAVADAGYTPLAHQTQDAWPTVQLWETVFLGQHGLETFQSFLDGDVDGLAEPVAESLSLIERYREHVSPDASSIAWDEANAQVITGDAAFTHQGDWAAGHYSSAELTYGEEWSHVAFPGTDGVYTMVLDSFVMPDPNPSPELTSAFLQYCGSVDAQRRFNQPKGSIPPRTDVPAEEFPPFLQDQMADFDASGDQLPTITHGSAIHPATKNQLEEAFASFLESWNVETTAERLLEIVGP